MAKKIKAAELNRMALRGDGKVTRTQSKVPSQAEIEAAKPPAPPAAPQPSPAPIPAASMSASTDVINERLAAVVDSNTRAIEAFRQEMLNKKPVPGVAYRHKVMRGRDKLIDYVDSIPLEII